MFILYFVLASIITTVCTTVGVPGRRVYAAQDAVQVLHRYGDGGYRHEYQYRKAGQDRGQADFHGLLLLGRYCVRQHCNAALARVPLSGMKKAQRTNVLCAFRVSAAV